MQPLPTGWRRAACGICAARSQRTDTGLQTRARMPNATAQPDRSGTAVQPPHPAAACGHACSLNDREALSFRAAHFIATYPHISLDHTITVTPVIAITTPVPS